MLQIDNTIISLDIIEKKFACDIKKCKGACCIEGDAGAPLKKEEIKEIEKILPKIKNYLSGEGHIVIKELGVYVIDDEKDIVTPLVNNKQCAFSFIEDGITRCAIEKAYFDGIISFRKPISCHLYPIRIKCYKQFNAINYDENKICKSAIELGNKTNTKLYKFLQEPLERNYGKNWYEKLEYAAENIHENSNLP